jgi:thioredoxin reductase (NADPH)
VGEVQTDCLIIGGGPAGLTAAIYLARFRLRTLVIDAGKSRAALIPCTNNHAGFPHGISGKNLLARMRQQAHRFGVEFQEGYVETLTKVGHGFVASSGSNWMGARSVLLATGVTNIAPRMPADIHDEALSRGRLRYCPVCDGYEASGQRIAVLGTGARGIKEAEFLRSYSEDVSLVAPHAPHELGTDDRGRLSSVGVSIIDGPARDFELTADKFGLVCAAGKCWFDTMYPALGSEIHSDLAIALGADCSHEGCIRVDSHQSTSVPGLFAAGDVVLGLDQISHAMGEAGVAATAMRNEFARTGALLFTGSAAANSGRGGTLLGASGRFQSVLFP